MGLVKLLILLSGCVLYTSMAMAQITVVCMGKGPPVYLIGGGPAFTTWNLEPIQQRLASHYKVCRWDMRGVGKNAELEIDKDQPVLMQWLHDMAMILPQQPVILWGHSWGALQVLLFTRIYPERVKALILNNPVDPELKSLEGIEFKRYVHPYVESKMNIDDFDTPAEKRHHFRSKIASYFMDAEKGWAYSAGFDFDDSNNELNVMIWNEYRDMPLKQTDLVLISSKVTRLIFCRQDVLMPESLEVYSKTISSDKHSIINDCAHFPWIESSEEFYDILLKSITSAQY